MDLTPDLLLEAKFSPARRGYDMNEVDDFLERCAEGLDVLLARLRAEFERAERAEAALAELQAGGAAVAPQAPAEPAPEPDASRVQEPMRILLAAERTAEAAIADARAEAERIRAEAESIASTRRSEAETLLARAQADAEAEARRAGEEARRAIEAEVLALREDRDLLSADVANLRRWLDRQRDRVRTTAAELQRLVDDPDALRDDPAPELQAGGQVGPEEPAEDFDDVEGDGVEAGVDDDVVDARTGDDVRGDDVRGDDVRGDDVRGGYDPAAGEPTQAVSRFGDGELDGPSLFDEERASTATGDFELR